MSDTAYDLASQQWRDQRAQRVFSDTGWYSVIGLHWLDAGATICGADASCDLIVPADLAPARLLTFRLQNGQVTYELFEAAQGVVAGQAVTAGQMTSDREPQPTVLSAAGLQFELLARGAKRGIRIRQPGRKPVRAQLAWFPTDATWSVTGVLERYQSPIELEVPTVLGLTEKLTCPGEVKFSLAGERLALLPVYPDASQSSLMFIFRDRTSGRETYAAGRFLMTGVPVGQNTEVTLDFNRAICPPCAYTAFATCPLPPPGNDLQVAITAGEKSPETFE